MNLLTLENTLDGIISGEYDNHIDKLSEAIKERKSLLRAQEATSLKFKLVPGETRVRFKAMTKPKYLAGVEGTVVKVNPKKVLVQVDEGTNPFAKGAYLGQKINCPLSILELV